MHQAELVNEYFQLLLGNLLLGGWDDKESFQIRELFWREVERSVSCVDYPS